MKTSRLIEDDLVISRVVDPSAASESFGQRSQPRLNREPLATLGPATSEYLATLRRLHARPKSVDAFALDVTRLISAFHSYSFLCLVRRCAKKPPFQRQLGPESVSVSRGKRRAYLKRACKIPGPRSNVNQKWVEATAFAGAAGVDHLRLSCKSMAR